MRMSRTLLLGVFAAARDMTAQKRAETEIAEQRARERSRVMRHAMPPTKTAPITQSNQFTMRATRT